MRTVFVLFDSLNRLALQCYGGTAIKTPNFDRLAQRGIVFDRHYVGSLPCMPARRDMHTGRLNFMHRSWGPLEPFDNSFARILSQNGCYTHLISDHLHYFEEGGTGYVNSFDSWDFIRGQEYDALKALAQPPVARYREKFDPRHYPMDRLQEGKTLTRGSTDPAQWKRLQHMVTRDFITREEEFPTAKCFASAFDFLDHNREADNWFLQLECFDPHEPFHVPERFKEAYDQGYQGKILDWPYYEKVSNSAEEIAEIRGNYAALVAMCDDYFGRLLDYFDKHDLWKDTALVLTTDHGFLLSEHEWWGKNRMPYYEEISHIPLMIHHPDHTDQAGTRRQALTQTTDLMPTFLDFHNAAPLPREVTGSSLGSILKKDEPVRESVILGMFSGPLCVNDGRFSYFRYPKDLSGENLNLYTLMPAHLSRLFDIDELKTAQLVEPFDFTKEAPLLKIRMDPRNSQTGNDGAGLADTQSVLFDLQKDPDQLHPLEDAQKIAHMVALAGKELARHDAPQEIFDFYDIPNPNMKSQEKEVETA